MIETEGVNTMSDLSASDVLAMTRDNGGFLEGNGIIILLLFLLFLGGGFGGIGGNSAMQGAMTRAEMQDGFNNQNTVNSLNNLEIGINNGFGNIQMGLCNGFNGVQSSISQLGFNMQQCCCDLKTTIHSEGESTRALITSNTIQDLRDQLAAKDRELLATGLVTANNIQTQRLENFIRDNTATTPATTA